MTCRGTSKGAEHPGYVQHNISDHEYVMNVMVIAGGDEHPSSARESSKEADEEQKAGPTRGGGTVQVVLQPAERESWA